MRIVHLSIQPEGGAGRAAKRLHEGLRRIGHESLLFVRDLREREEGIVAFDSRANVFTRGVRSLRRKRIEADFAAYRKNRTEGQEVFSDDRGVLGAELQRQLPSCDVINLHWVAEFIDYSDFLSKIPRRVPVVWTLHDMNPFTGGCHYDRDCGKFAAECGACPELGSRDETDLSRRIWGRKSGALERAQPGRRTDRGGQQLAGFASEEKLFVCETSRGGDPLLP